MVTLLYGVWCHYGPSSERLIILRWKLQRRTRTRTQMQYIASLQA